MADPVQLTLGDVTLTRVEYFDIGLDPVMVALTAEQVNAQPWAVPAWATPDGQVLVGQAMWVLESGGSTIVVDPCGASDDFLRTGPEAITHQEAMLAALAAAGFARESVDVVLLSHLDGIGLVGVVDDAGRWSPAFPHARVVVPRVHLDHLAGGGVEDLSGLAAFRQVQGHGVVDGVEDGAEVAPQVTVQLTGAHIAGHAVIRVGAPGEEAILLGHLAVSPLHTATGVCEGLNDDPPAAWAALGALVDEAADSGALLIGPLWPHPGAGRVERTTGGPTVVPIAG